MKTGCSILQKAWFSLYLIYLLGDRGKRNRAPKTLGQSDKPIKAGNQWSKPKFQKYPDLNRHLEAQINKQNTIFRYPQPVEKPYSWNHK